MRSFFLIALSLSCTSLFTQTSFSQMATRTVVSDDAEAETTAVAPPAPRLSYEQIKRSYRADSALTLAGVRADAATNSGRVLELTGRISGLMSTSRGRTVIFEQDGNTAVFPMTLDLPGVELVSAGQNVRGLFLISLEREDVALKPLGFAAASSPASLPPAIAAAVNRSASISFSAPSSGGADGILMAPPTWDMALPDDSSPQPMVRMSQPRISSRDRSGGSLAPAPVPSSSSDSSSGTYSNLARRFNSRLTAGQAAEIGNAIVAASRTNGLDPRFLSSIIAVESNFNPYCVSSSGAMGLCQIMPFNLKSLGITNAWNPTQNIFGAAKMLRNNLNDYRGRADATLLAVAAYNAGGGAVKRAGYQVPGGSQVQRYVWKVYNQYKAFAPELFASR